MSELIQKDLTLASNFLPSQFSSSEKLKTFLGIFLNKVQELEDANIDLNNVSTNIATSYGYQLDIIGKLIGTTRGGRSDKQYRDAIYFQISLNTGNGTPEDSIQYLSYVTEATKVGYWEHYPASVILETNGTNIPSNIPNTLDNITPAGVSVGGVIVSETGQVFRGCDTTIAYSNFEDITSPFLEIECGGDLDFSDDTIFSGDDVQAGDNAQTECLISSVECGALEAECVYQGFTGFRPVADSDPLARCIFPDQASNQLNFGLTTKGVFADVYTKI